MNGGKEMDSSINFDDVIKNSVGMVDLTVSSRDTALKQVMDIYCSIPGAFDDEPETIADHILQFSQEVVSRYNVKLKEDGGEKSAKWIMPRSIEPFQLAMCVLKANNAINLSYVDDTAEGDIAVYCEEGLREGLYVTDIDYINSIIYSYHTGISKQGIDEVMTRLKAWAPRKVRNLNRDLIPVYNGIFDYKRKCLMDFSPEYVFLTKSHTSYNPNASNVVITNPEDGTTWDVESWMNELTDDPEITNLLWEITGALLRPNVAWNKSAWLYSDMGENGKGTLCKMWRNLCGSAAASIPISEFSKDFMLSSLTTSQAIIVDENDVGTFIDKAGNLKAIITNDVVQINRKFKNPIRYQFHGFMVQCLNELPRFRDKSDSIYRRQLFIPMNKCFTGVARTYIKDDYISRKEVLEYVMKKTLEMDYYKLSEPDACQVVLDEYKIYNDPVRQFWTEFEDQFVWDILPYSFLYSLFKEWFKRDNPSGSIMGRNTFIKDLQNVVKTSDVFMVPIGADKIRTTNRMDKTETLIATYNLVDWQTPGMSSKSSTIEAMCQPIIAESYRGLMRIVHPQAAVSDEEGEACADCTETAETGVTENKIQNTATIPDATGTGGPNDKILKMPPPTVNSILSHTPAPASHIETNNVQEQGPVDVDERKQPRNKHSGNTQ